MRTITTGAASHATIARSLRSLAIASLIMLVTGAASPAHAAHPGDDPRISGGLHRLLDAHERGGESGVRTLARSLDLATREERGTVLVPVILEPRAGLSGRDLDHAAIEWLGVRFDAASRSFVRVFAPVSRLRALAAHPDLRRIREPITALPSAGLGPRVSESVALTGADVLQASGTRGAGIKVAVVDLGYIGLTNAITEGELVAPVRVDLPGTQDDDLESGHDHGTAVAEHVADMAPDAQIHCIKVSDEVDLENAAAYCAANGVRIANHSVAWVNASYYDDTGPINGIINESRDVDGVFWTLAAGNFARRHWRGAWVDVNGNQRIEFVGADERLDLTGGAGTARVYLNWNQYGNSVTDLDFYVYDKNGVVVDSSLNRQSGPENPAESLRFFYSGAGIPYQLEIRRFSGPTAGLDLTIMSANTFFEYGQRASSLMDPADAHGAFAVAAVEQVNWNLANPPTEPFSSEGPTNDGRMKPELTGPDGTTSLTYGPHGAYGTSFAAPTVAGAAALLLEQDPSLTADQLGARLQERARDVGAPGVDPVYGAGMLVVPVAVPFASPLLLAAIALLLGATALGTIRRATKPLARTTH